MAQASLLLELTKSGVKLQNENSVLGFIWYLLGPLLLFGILLFVFANRLGADIEHYSLYLLLGIISWNFFATGTGRSLGVLQMHGELIKSVPMRLELLVLSAVLHALVSHVLELCLFIGIMLWLGLTPGLIILFLGVLLLTFLFIFGIGLVLASTFVFCRDIEQIWAVLTRAWWFATPIFYAPTLSGPGAFLSLFNPMYYVVHIGRELLIYHRVPDLVYFLALLGFVGASLLIGHIVFWLLRSHIAAKL